MNHKISTNNKINSSKNMMKKEIKKEDSEYIRKIYRDRWKIETHFRTIKYNLNLSHITSKTLINLKQKR